MLSFFSAAQNGLSMKKTFTGRNVSLIFKNSINSKHFAKHKIKREAVMKAPEFVISE